mmetsp:Transcript_41377/g.81060  ORF Transcript_41377/g.81060 Transcript_41377/m.81060 type:complete len:205 (-) Transcript_41377:588-1202(-)
MARSSSELSTSIVPFLSRSRECSIPSLPTETDAWNARSASASARSSASLSSNSRAILISSSLRLALSPSAASVASLSALIRSSSALSSAIAFSASFAATAFAESVRTRSAPSASVDVSTPSAERNLLTSATCFRTAEGPYRGRAPVLPGMTPFFRRPASWSILGRKAATSVRSPARHLATLAAELAGARNLRDGAEGEIGPPSR